jgi:competence protein ComEC
VSLALVLLAVAAPSVSRAETLCVSGLARRAARETCWAKFALGEGRDLCVPRALWRERLVGPRAGPLCGEWRGRWKAVAFPSNTRADGPKRSRLRFVAEALPAAARPAGVLAHATLAVERLRERCSALLARKDGLGILRRLLLDERAHEDAAGLLRLSGFVHVVTASGIHLYALAAAAERIAFAAGAAAGVPARAAIGLSRGLAALLWLLAWLLSGLRPGLLRPWLIVAGRHVALARGVRWRPWAPLALALALDCAVALVHAARGEDAWAPGRWHYALAVGGGLAAIQLRRGRSAREAANPMIPGGLADHAVLAVGSWVLVALWDAWHLGLVAPFTPVLSVLTIPIGSALALPAMLGLALALAADEGLGVPAAALADALGASVTWVFEWLARLTLAAGGIWEVGPGAFWGGIAASTALLAATRGARGPGLALLALLLCVRAGQAPAGQSAGHPRPSQAREVRQLDVGQGDAALVLSEDSAGLIDAGPERALGPSAWLALLSGYGVRSLDWVALTHLDEDHAGGLRRLAALVPIGCVATSSAELSTDRGRRLAAGLARLGVRVTDWSGRCVPFPVLGPPPDRARRRANGSMSAVLVPLPGGAYLSMGDADRAQEPRLAAWANARLAEREIPPDRLVLKISHHGSATSSAPAALRLLRPREAWISCGLGNRFGHPTPEVLHRLRGEGIPVRRTDRDGCLRAGAGPRPR